ncbi:hypothetical protein FBR02_12350 [Anaerolineae bacterium CFX9]|nr:hypothetical protein [Anaerolineae bacterium CFX9]
MRSFSSDSAHRAVVTAFLFLLAALLIAACGGAPSEPSAAAASADNASETNLSAQAEPVQQADPSSMGTQSAPAQQALPPGVLPTNAAGESIVARVNGQEITLGEYQRVLARYEQQQITAADANSLRAVVLNTMIEQILIEQAAAAQGIAIEDAELESELNNARQLAGSGVSWEDWLASNLYSEAEFRETLRDALLTGRMRDQITSDLLGSVLQVRARHILVGSAAEAQALIDRANAGEDFGMLAQQNSRDITSRDLGGDLGWFTAEELLEPVLAQAAFSQEVGAVGGPIESSLGWHVLQVVERGERPVPEEKRADLAQRRFEQWLDQLSASATIELFI